MIISRIKKKKQICVIIHLILTIIKKKLIKYNKFSLLYFENLNNLLMT